MIAVRDQPRKKASLAAPGADAKAARQSGPEAIERLIAEKTTALAADPRDERLRHDTAQALADGGRWREAVQRLEETLVNLTAHDPSTLPCLCRRCLPREGGERPAAELGEMRFTVDFVVARGRVLYYWLPGELGASRRLVARSVEAELKQRLAGR